MLRSKIAQANLSVQRGSQGEAGYTDAMDTQSIDPEIEQQLQAHGFHFTELQAVVESPDTGSIGSELNNASPQPTYPSRRKSDIASNMTFGAINTHTPESRSSQAQRPGYGSPEGQELDYINRSDFDQLFQNLTYDFSNIPDVQGGAFGSAR